MRIPKHKILQLSANLLSIASDRFCNDICTDMSFPKDWTADEIDELSRYYEKINRDYDPDFPIGDNWIAMNACSEILLRLADKEKSDAK